VLALEAAQTTLHTAAYGLPTSRPQDEAQRSFMALRRRRWTLRERTAAPRMALIDALWLSLATGLAVQTAIANVTGLTPIFAGLTTF